MNKKWEWLKNAQGFFVCQEATQSLTDAAEKLMVIAQFATSHASKSKTSTRQVLRADVPKVTVTGYGEPVPVKCGKGRIPKTMTVENHKTPMQKNLISQRQKAFDRCCGDVLKTANLRISPKFGIDRVCTLISDYMRSEVEPYDDGWYIGVGGTRFMKLMKNNPDFRSWKEYLREGDLFYQNEHGAYGPIRWVETLDALIFVNDGVVFGADALGVVKMDPVHLIISDSEISWRGAIGYRIAKQDRVIYIGNDKKKVH